MSSSGAQEPHHTKQRQSAFSTEHPHRATGVPTKCFGHDASRCFFRPPLSLVPKRLTAAFTAQDGEVPSVGEVGKRRHRIILRVRPCVSWPNWTNVMATAPRTPTPLSHRPAPTPKKTSVRHAGRKQSTARFKTSS